MSAASDRIDTNTVKMPGNMMSPTVSSAPDQLLVDEIPRDLAFITRILEPKGMVLSENEQLPDGYESQFTRGERNNLCALKRVVKLLHACRQELADRANQRRAERKADHEDAKGRLQRLVDDGPDMLAEVRKRQAEGAEAMTRMRQFINDVQAVAEGHYAEKQEQLIESGIAAAAKALNKAPPKLPPRPEGTPTRDDMDAMMMTIRGMQAGFDLKRIGVGDASKVNKLTRKL